MYTQRLGSLSIGLKMAILPKAIVDRETFFCCMVSSGSPKTSGYLT
jgi:hypothetical protein